MVRFLTSLLFSLVVCQAPVPNALPPAECGVPDGRMVRLETFFDLHGCPAPYHTTDYLRAADRYALDYRLLPAISVAESTCGQYCRLNNYWGWDSARTGFVSVPSGINYITKQLAHGVYYKGVSLDQKLHAYNPGSSYASFIKKLMREIDREP
ncbi:MAG: hypothetical protein ACRD9L_12665, partial [Bryobacteraceae bacterium]